MLKTELDTSGFWVHVIDDQATHQLGRRCPAHPVPDEDLKCRVQQLTVVTGDLCHRVAHLVRADSDGAGDLGATLAGSDHLGDGLPSDTGVVADEASRLAREFVGDPDAPHEIRLPSQVGRGAKDDPVHQAVAPKIWASMAP